MESSAQRLISLVKTCHAQVPELAVGLAIEPEEKSCPGVYGKGCTGNLIQLVHGDTGEPFWRCHMSLDGMHRGLNSEGVTATGFRRGSRIKRGCGYKLYPKQHLKVPTLSISICGDDTVEVLPAEGGAYIVSMCGGIEGILRLIDEGLFTEDGCVVSEMRMEFKLSSYRLVLRRLIEFKRAVNCLDKDRVWFDFEPIPGSTQNCYFGCLDKNRSSKKEVESRFASLPVGFRSALLPFQVDGIQFVLRRKGRGLIADEMGVGKTVQAIGLAGCYKDKWPVLVVVPASLRLVWAEEFEKWMPDLSPADIQVIFDSADKLHVSDKYKIVIISYDMLRRLSCERCCNQERDLPNNVCSSEGCIASHGNGWKMVIADESHKLATSAFGSDSKITNAVRSICRRADHVVFLSGTPSLNKPFDLYNQINIIRRDVLPGTRDAFGVKYCDKRLVPCHYSKSGFRYDYSGLSRAKELHLLLRREVMIRRMKIDIAEQLPEKIRQVVRLPEPMQSDWPSATEIIKDDNGNELERKKLSQFHRVGIAKSGMVIQWLLEKLGPLDGQYRMEDGTKIVVFAHHRKVMNAIASRLDEASPDIYIRIDGQTDSVTRHEELEKFRLCPKVRIAVVSVTAGGTGLDFTAASAVAFAELPPHASLVRQAEDRVHRRGQKNSVNVFFLCAMNTFDDRQWQYLNKRLQKVDVVHNGPVSATGSCQPEKGLTVGNIVRYGLNFCNESSIGVDIQRHSNEEEYGNSMDGRAVRRKDELPANNHDSDEFVDEASECLVIPDSQDDSDGDIYDGSFDEWNPKWQFVVSRHTKRIHVFRSEGAGEGEQPLLFSVPIMAITGETEDCAKNLIDAYNNLGNRSSESIMLQGIGPMFVDRQIAPTVEIFEAALHQCTRFAREWIEVSNIYKDRLYSRLLQTPLDAVIEEEVRSAQHAGEIGSSNSRFITGATFMRDFRNRETLLNKFPHLKMAEEVEGTVTYKGRVFPYVQPVLWQRNAAGERNGGPGSEDGPSNAVPVCPENTNTITRLCINCTKPAFALDAKCLQKDISNPSVLFCSIKCENDLKVKSNGGAARIQVMKRDRGVCEMCKLNCSKLIQQLQAIEKDSNENGDESWRQKREHLLDTQYSDFVSRLTKVQKKGLIEKALSGKAWQADHIVPVFEGGGHCTLMNMRTLCTACHREVTAAQAAKRKRERAELRKLAKNEQEENGHPNYKRRKDLKEQEAENLGATCETHEILGADPSQMVTEGLKGEEIHLSHVSRIEKLLERSKKIQEMISRRRQENGSDD
jgi:superfamily II DNA or RNA helicase